MSTGVRQGDTRFGGWRNFPTVLDQAGEYYIEPERGFWSIVAPSKTRITNYLANPSFETNTDGWFSFGGSIARIPSTVTQTNALYGAWALEVTGDLSNQPYTVLYSTGGLGFGPSPFSPILVPPGETYYVSTYVKGCVGDNIEITALTDVLISPIVPGPVQRIVDYTATGDWQLIQSSYTNQTNSDLPVTLSITVTPASPSCSTLLVDGAVISDVKTDHYIDGSIEGAEWQGIAHASASQSTGNARCFGESIRLSDVGFLVTNYLGHGIPTVLNENVPYSLLGGAHYERTVPSTRIITLTGVIEEKGILSLQRVHAKLVELVGLYNFYLDPQPICLEYNLTECGNDITGKLQIRAVYTAGLEGNVANTYRERLTVQFTSYDDLFWHKETENCVVLTPNQVNLVNYQGTAPTPMRLEVRGDTVGPNNVDFTSLENLTIDRGVYFDSGANGFPFVIVPSGLTFVFNSGQRNMSAVRTNGVFTDNQVGQISRPQSRPTEVMLVPGVNEILPTFANQPSGPAQTVLCWRDSYWSASDVARFDLQGVL